MLLIIKGLFQAGCRVLEVGIQPDGRHATSCLYGS
jgi:hypothetical protein